jgi:hypothetical protein
LILWPCLKPDGPKPSSLETHNRAADNWRPLFAVADAAGAEWPERARQAACKLVLDGAKDESSTRVMLLAGLRDLFADGSSGVLFTTAEILPRLHVRDDRPSPEYRQGKPITAR